GIRDFHVTGVQTCALPIWEFKEVQGTDEVNYEVTFNRLDVPVLVGLKLGNTFRIQAGPVASFVVNSDVTRDVGNAALPDYKKSTLAYQVGVGLDIGNMILEIGRAHV